MVWSKKQSTISSPLPWESTATQALEQAVNQAPVPGLLKGKIKKELQKAAESFAISANHSTVTAEDLIQGLLTNMPAPMRDKIQQAIKQGPEGIKDLAKDFDNNQNNSSS